jgi:ABC-2 type transport system ATP-binding protein
LDEITANVDPLLKHDIWNVLNDFQIRFKRSIIMTSHDSYELQYVCSHIVHIDNGVLKTDEKVNNLIVKFNNAKHTISINEIIYK